MPKLRRKPRRFFLWCSQLLAVPLACILSVAPFATPFLAIKLAQRRVWYHACSNFPIEIVLHGRYFQLPDTKPIASFLYVHRGVRTPLYDYSLSLRNDSDSWTFDLQSVSPDVELSLVLRPLISSISYNPSNRTVSGLCRSSTDISASSEEVCVEGQYDDTVLSFNITDTQTLQNYRSRVIDKQWYYEDNTDGPSLILYDIRPDGKRGPMAMRTAVTWIDCTLLKICSTKVSGPELLVPIGRILKAQDGYAFSCSKPSV